MIYRDRISVVIRVLGQDDSGNDAWTETEVPHRAEVRPLSGTEVQTSGDQVTTRFRVFLPRTAPALRPTDALIWRGQKYEVKGSVEPHTINGRTHHYEAIVERVTG